MKHKKIIFVCTGNTCRSPMAEAAFRAELKRRRIAWYTILSAGLDAQDGSPMSENAAQALREAGIPYSQTFGSRLLTDKMIKEAYAVVCMTERHRYRLKDYPNVASMQLLAGREIADPYGLDIGAYRETLREIRLCFPQVLAGLGMTGKNKKGD